MKKVVFLLAAVLLSIPVAGLSAGEDIDLQKLIDEALPGDVISVPAGTYRGNFRLKEGVILEGAGAHQTVLDGNGAGTVLMGDYGCIVKGFTITNGASGINSGGRLMGIFENVIRDNKGGGIYLGGGGGLVVNNLIQRNQGKGGVDLARSYVVVANNTIVEETAGLDYWEVFRGVAINNIIAYNELGIRRDEASNPAIENNVFWSNRKDVEIGDLEGENLFFNPFFQRPGGEDFGFMADPALREMGIALPGIPSEIFSGLGCSLPTTYPLETYRALLAGVEAMILQWKPLVIYGLSEEPGCFEVTTLFPRPDFKVGSSTKSTAIEDIVAYDVVNSSDLLSSLVPEDHPLVEVRGRGGEVYPEEDERYVMESVFCKPESCFEDEDGNLHFRRKTTFSRIRILLPEGYEIAELTPAGEADPENGVISLVNPRWELMEINLILTPMVE